MGKQKLPTTTPLQWAVLSALLSKERSGAELRQALRDDFGVRKSGPAFYQLMARLEEAGFVNGRYQPKVVDGQVVRQRHYKITGSGRRAWEETRSFFDAQTSGVVAH